VLLDLGRTWDHDLDPVTTQALHTLVHQPEFVVSHVDAARGRLTQAHLWALEQSCRITFSPELLPMLEAFSQGSLAAAGAVAVAQQIRRPSTVGGSADPEPGHSQALILFITLLTLSCLGLGWVAYRLTHPATAPMATEPLGPIALPPLPPPPPLPVPDRRQATTVPQFLPQGEATTVALGCMARAAGPERPEPADPSNYDRRQSRDWRGSPVLDRPSLIVLHETVVDEDSALALFRRHQPDDARQASYHVLIGRDGRRIRVVPDEQRAFGAGDSDFQGQSVQLRQDIPPSVNNFALHVSLVSPSDGSDGERRDHSGYTAAQYRSLAAQIALWMQQYGISADRVVTHRDVDRSGSRHDPRSFDWSLLSQDLKGQLFACGITWPVAAGRR
jgi:N-acetyl-anhydromuramyl-L-alanine amidase AmpD